VRKSQKAIPQRLKPCPDEKRQVLTRTKAVFNT
jgi:hypothetical protein